MELLGQGRSQGVVGGEVGAHLPGPGPEGSAGVAAQAEAVGGGQCLHGIALLQLTGEHKPVGGGAASHLDRLHDAGGDLGDANAVGLTAGQDDLDRLGGAGHVVRVAAIKQR